LIPRANISGNEFIIRIKDVYDIFLAGQVDGPVAVHHRRLHQMIISLG